MLGKDIFSNLKRSFVVGAIVGILVACQPSPAPPKYYTLGLSDCQQPCWHGLEINFSDSNDIENYLSSDPYIENWELKADGDLNIYWFWWLGASDTPNSRNSLTMGRESQLLSEMYINDIRPSVSIQEMFASYGLPDSMSIAHFYRPQYRYVIDFYYITLGRIVSHSQPAPPPEAMTSVCIVVDKPIFNISIRSQENITLVLQNLERSNNTILLNPEDIFYQVDSQVSEYQAPCFSPTLIGIQQ